ncbi:putative exodeoxyribonuclease V, alpha subunit [Chlamydia pneumoniae LPCoLN]|uniref:exodeoxyribonuclease V subunit alpha n=1 Tax=Chlamydia pneumoniae TaxID=83558 RepID=UPI0001BD9D49|nr:exodeoxyribonuclease V subunit alpha [Chlamydia pneumoniae]ACZ32641.1 putative exodeoxyribonuclease V, alpha subunit [Chlamydia pneumoniae LPCoLN]ETR79498.1 Exodeoxyribonuclease V alpha chain [Chlamydia pneumoniae B21]
MHTEFAPFLEDLVHQQVISLLDIAFASKHISSDFEESFVFLAVSSALWRYGHPFLSLEENRIRPSLGGISETDLYRGFHNLPKEVRDKLFVVVSGRLYLRSLYTIRSKLLDKLSLLCSATPNYFPPSIDSSILSEEQNFIFNKITQGCFSIVSGGPGTGKTFLAAQLILSLVKQQPKLRIAIVSPTGKATSHIRQILMKYNIFDDMVLMQTVHHFLQEYAYRRYNSIDVLLVDEGSMVTFDLLYSLVQTLQGYEKDKKLYTSSLIILGDTNQLPPIGIGVGNPLQDLIGYFHENTFFLKTSHRAKTGAVDQLTQSVLRGEMIPFSPLPSISSAIEVLKDRFVKSLRQSEARLCVLTPMRHGPWGVLNLNTMIHQRLARSDPDLRIPIMVTSRYETWGLFNGDTGLLCLKTQKLHFPQHEPIDSRALSQYVYNYVMSVHKSQGSEYDEVIVIIPKGSEVFGVSILYTAITRAKYRVSVWGDPETLHKIIKKSNY